MGARGGVQTLSLVDGCLGRARVSECSSYHLVGYAGALEFADAAFVKAYAENGRPSRGCGFQSGRPAVSVRSGLPSPPNPR